MVALYHFLLQVLYIIGDKKKYVCLETYTFQFCVSNNVKKKKNSASNFVRPRVMLIYYPICGFLRRQPKLKSVVNKATAHSEILR